MHRVNYKGIPTLNRSLESRCTNQPILTDKSIGKRSSQYGKACKGSNWVDIRKSKYI